MRKMAASPHHWRKPIKKILQKSQLNPCGQMMLSKRTSVKRTLSKKPAIADHMYSVHDFRPFSLCFVTNQGQNFLWTKPICLNSRWVVAGLTVFLGISLWSGIMFKPWFHGQCSCLESKHLAWAEGTFTYAGRGHWFPFCLYSQFSLKSCCRAQGPFALSM